MRLPRKYISWSQISSWLYSKDVYRKRYFLNVEEPKSPELFFGARIARELENKSIVIPGLILLPVAEERVEVEINGIPVLGFIDQFDPASLRFRETKTGKTIWDEKRVKNHKQMDMYSLLIETKFGTVDNEAYLDWIQTRNKIKTVEFDGHIMESVSNEIEATGEIQSFCREITRAERLSMADLIRTVAEEISEDYKRYTSLSASAEPVSIK